MIIKTRRAVHKMNSVERAEFQHNLPVVLASTLIGDTIIQERIESVGDFRRVRYGFRVAETGEWFDTLAEAQRGVAQCIA